MSTETATFTAADVVAKIREIAAGAPGFVYERPLCHNIETDENGQWIGSCIVGRAVVDLGISPEDILAKDLKARGAFGLLEGFNIPGAQSDYRWIHNVQAAQDNRAPWGAAVAWADDKLSAVAV